MTATPPADPHALTHPDVAGPMPPPATLHPRLAAMASVLTFPAGHVLFRRGERPQQMYTVVEGSVTLQRQSLAGEWITLCQPRAGQTLGESTLVAPVYRYDAVCKTRCRVQCLPIEAMRQAIDDDPEVRWAWIERVTRQSDERSMRAYRQGLKSIRERLRHLLMHRGDAEQAMSWQAYQSQLALELGVSREALCRELAELQARGELAVDGPCYRWLG